MTLPTYQPTATPTQALRYDPATEGLLIAEYGQDALLDLGADFGDYVVDHHGVPQRMTPAEFHASYHKPTNTAAVILELHDQNLTVTQIAKFLGVSRPTVYRALEDRP